MIFASVATSPMVTTTAVATLSSLATTVKPTRAMSAHDDGRQDRAVYDGNQLVVDAFGYRYMMKAYAERCLIPST